MLCNELKPDSISVERNHPHLVLATVRAVPLLPRFQLERHRGKESPIRFVRGTLQKAKLLIAGIGTVLNPLH